MMDNALSGMHIAILVSDGFEQVEFTDPKQTLEREGAITKVISDREGSVRGYHHDTPADSFGVDLQLDDADPEDFNAVLLPGGHINAGNLRHNAKAQAFVQAIAEQGKPIAVICHGPWLLVEAALVEGRRMTSWPSIAADLRAAGAEWVDAEVVVDGNWVSSRKPDDLPAFDSRMVEVFAASMQAGMRGSADAQAVGLASS